VRKLLVVSVLLNVVLVLWLLSREEPAQAEGDGRGAGTPSGNGDVNGDEKIDISDVIYTLNWLFGDGPSLVPIECPPAGLPATGQTKCYDNAGAEIVCDSAEFPGQDGFYQAGCPGEGRFVDNQDGTVTDTCTGLVWQKDTADVSGNGSIGDEDRITWQGALQYCDGLDFAGHDGWRLPNMRELLSIVDDGRYGPSIDPVFGAVSNYYWSSSSGVLNPDLAWYVNFHDGYVYSGRKAEGNYVRAVRSGP
jgi:hypothetical protein